MQRVRHHRRVDHLLYGDDVAQHRVRVVLRVVRGRDLDPGELLARRAELVHVAHRHHGVHVDRRRAVRLLERALGRAGAVTRLQAARAFRARPAREGDQRDVAAAGSDRRGCMRDMHDVRGTAGLGRVDVAHLEAEVFGHRQSRRAPGASPAQK